jgi:formate dehydrogenase subunit delta
MSPDKMIRMANQIATFFESKPHDEGLAGVVEHLNSFWEPRMRRQLLDHIATGGDGLRPLVLEAAARIRQPKAA